MVIGGGRACNDNDDDEEKEEEEEEEEDMLSRKNPQACSTFTTRSGIACSEFEIGLELC